MHDAGYRQEQTHASFPNKQTPALFYHVSASHRMHAAQSATSTGAGSVSLFLGFDPAIQHTTTAAGASCRRAPPLTITIDIRIHDPTLGRMRRQRTLLRLAAAALLVSVTSGFLFPVRSSSSRHTQVRHAGCPGLDWTGRLLGRTGGGGCTV